MDQFGSVIQNWKCYDIQAIFPVYQNALCNPFEVSLKNMISLLLYSGDCFSLYRNVLSLLFFISVAMVGMEHETF
jgi:hypothetical protein